MTRIVAFNALSLAPFFPKRSPAGEIAAPTTSDILWGLHLQWNSGVRDCPCFALRSFCGSCSRPRLYSFGTSCGCSGTSGPLIRPGRRPELLARPRP